MARKRGEVPKDVEGQCVAWWGAIACRRRWLYGIWSGGWTRINREKPEKLAEKRALVPHCVPRSHMKTRRLVPRCEAGDRAAHVWHGASRCIQQALSPVCVCCPSTDSLCTVLYVQHLSFVDIDCCVCVCVCVCVYVCACVCVGIATLVNRSPSPVPSTVDSDVL